jgi:hypothetical protein
VINKRLPRATRRRDIRTPYWGQDHESRTGQQVCQAPISSRFLSVRPSVSLRERSKRVPSAPARGPVNRRRSRFATCLERAVQIPNPIRVADHGDRQSPDSALQCSPTSDCGMDPTPVSRSRSQCSCNRFLIHTTVTRSFRRLWEPFGKSVWISSSRSVRNICASSSSSRIG